MVLPKEKGPFIEYLRADATQTAINTYKETEIPTPVGRANNIGMLIHEVTFEQDTVLDAIADADRCIFHLALVSHTETKGINDDGIIAKTSKIFYFTTSGAVVFNMQETHKFNPPLLVAKSKLFFGYNTAGQAAVKTGNIRIGYTLALVDKDAFIEALVD